MNSYIFLGVSVLVLLALLGVMGLVLSKLYNRSTKTLSFVRTGLGGEKVIKDGGAFVFPVVHEIVKVNMETLTVTVNRSQKEALITKDKLRVDVAAEFYLRVKPDNDAIAQAARTLGDKTMNSTRVKELVESKFVDALRSVAATMEMNELHENRADFVQAVQKALSSDLDKNGLELETVSLVGLDQTSMDHFNPNNAFDAEGLKALTSITQKKMEEKNAIEKDAQIAIERKNLEAKQTSLALQRDREYAELEQQREVAVRKAEQAREIAETEAMQTKISSLAKITAERETQEAEIARQKVIEAAEIERTKTIQTAEIDKERSLEEARIGKAKVLELAEQERAIEVAKKSELQSQARAEAERARKESVTETQNVLTVEAVAEAERAKQIAVIAERSKAEQDAAGVLVRAEAERKAAEDRAAARVTEATAERDAVTISAEAEASRISKIAEAKAKEYETEAKGKEAINAAADKLPQAERELQFKMALVQKMPDIVREMAKPIGDIDSFRVLDMRGSPLGDVTRTLNVDGQEITTTGGSGDLNADNLPMQIVNGLMKYKVSMPLLQKLTDELGIDLSEGLSGLTSGLDFSKTTEVETDATKSTTTDKRSKSTKAA